MDGRKRDRDDGYSRSSKSRRTEDDEPICTLHLTGLPSDVKERELRNLGIFLPGFEGAVINRRSSSRDRDAEPAPTMGFMKFVNPKSAMAALQGLHGHVFDEDEADRPLRVSMAKRNMHVSRSSSYMSRAAPQMSGMAPFNPYLQVPEWVAPGADQFGAAAYGGYDMAMAAAAQAAAVAAAQQHQHHQQAAPAPHCSVAIISNTTGTPCDTLCIQGMTRQSSQSDVEALFTSLNGFRDIKVFGSKGLGFVRFENDQDSCAAMEELNGLTVALPGGDSRTTVRIEYAKRSLEEVPPSSSRDRGR